VPICLKPCPSCIARTGKKLHQKTKQETLRKKWSQGTTRPGQRHIIAPWITCTSTCLLTTALISARVVQQSVAFIPHLALCKRGAAWRYRHPTAAASPRAVRVKRECLWQRAADLCPSLLRPCQIIQRNSLNLSPTSWNVFSSSSPKPRITPANWPWPSLRWTLPPRPVGFLPILKLCQALSTLRAAAGGSSGFRKRRVTPAKYLPDTARTLRSGSGKPPWQDQVLASSRE